MKKFLVIIAGEKCKFQKIKNYHLKNLTNFIKSEIKATDTAIKYYNNLDTIPNSKYINDKIVNLQTLKNQFLKISTDFKSMNIGDNLHINVCGFDEILIIRTN